jgi:hypothetical protein
MIEKKKKSLKECTQTQIKGKKKTNSKALTNITITSFSSQITYNVKNSKILLHVVSENLKMVAFAF